MPMSEREAVEALGRQEAPEGRPEVAVEAETPEVKEGEAPKMVRPKRRFRWIDDKNMTVPLWLADKAAADIEIFPGVVFRFREAKNSELREADAYVNAMGPQFIMRGIPQGVEGLRDDLPRGEQWARARNVGMVAMTISHMGGKSWPEGETFADRFKSIDDMGHVKVDRLIQGMSEFTEQLAWLVRETDLPNF